jgi:hypothetical protein
MKKIVLATIASALTLLASTAAMATPSTQIWIPSTDIQGFGTGHLGIDNYIRSTSNGGGNNYYDIGLTAGILPFEKIQAEIGIDYLDGGLNNTFDKHPVYFNAKLGTPEDSLFKLSPALAVGVFGLGTNNDTYANGGTAQNVAYGLVAKTLPVVGRISAGGFHGSEKVLADENGNSANDGVLLSWDRTMSEISDKLWLAVDYQSGKSSLGALSFGASWAFAKNVSVIFGYDIYNNVLTGGKNTFTTQLDIIFP